MSKHEKACWLKVPPECPVRAPVMVSVALPDGVVEVGIGEFQGGEGCARICVGDLEFSSEVSPIEAGAADVLEQLARRVRSDLAVGRIVRELIGKKPLLAKMVEAFVEVMAGELDEGDREVLRGITNPRRREGEAGS